MTIEQPNYPFDATSSVNRPASTLKKVGVILGLAIVWLIVGSILALLISIFTPIDGLTSGRLSFVSLFLTSGSLIGLLGFCISLYLMFRSNDWVNKGFAIIKFCALALGTIFLVGFGMCVLLMVL